MPESKTEKLPEEAAKAPSDTGALVQKGEGTEQQHKASGFKKWVVAASADLGEAISIPNLSRLAIKELRGVKEGWMLFLFGALAIGAVAWFLASYVYSRTIEANEITYTKEKAEVAKQTGADIKALTDKISTEEDAKLEAERTADKFEALYHDDENTMIPLRDAANKQFPDAPVAKSVDLLLQKVDVIQRTISTSQPDPLRQAIASATATVSLDILRDDPIFGGGIGIGGVIAFGKGNDALLEGGVAQFGSGDAKMENGANKYQFVCPASVDSNYMGKPISDLLDAQYIQIESPLLKKGSSVLSGSVVWVINNSITLKFTIPPQVPDDKSQIFIRDLSDGFKPLVHVQSTANNSSVSP